MKIEVTTHHRGRLGASFTVTLGDKTSPRLSVNAAERLIAELSKALNSHADASRGRS